MIFALRDDQASEGEKIKSECDTKALSGPGPESSHGGMIDKETKTKEGKYLGGGCLHTNTLG